MCASNYGYLSSATLDLPVPSRRKKIRNPWDGAISANLPTSPTQQKRVSLNAGRPGRPTAIRMPWQANSASLPQPLLTPPQPSPFADPLATSGVNAGEAPSLVDWFRQLQGSGLPGTVQANTARRPTGRNPWDPPPLMGVREAWQSMTPGQRRAGYLGAVKQNLGAIRDTVASGLGGLHSLEDWWNTQGPGRPLGSHSLPVDGRQAATTVAMQSTPAAFPATPRAATQATPWETTQADAAVVPWEGWTSPDPTMRQVPQGPAGLSTSATTSAAAPWNINTAMPADYFTGADNPHLNVLYRGTAAEGGNVDDYRRKTFRQMYLDDAARRGVPFLQAMPEAEAYADRRMAEWTGQRASSQAQATPSMSTSAHRNGDHAFLYRQPSPSDGTPATAGGQVAPSTVHAPFHHNVNVGGENFQVANANRGVGASEAYRAMQTPWQPDISMPAPVAAQPTAGQRMQQADLPWSQVSPVGAADMTMPQYVAYAKAKAAAGEDVVPWRGPASSGSRPQSTTEMLKQRNPDAYAGVQKRRADRKTKQQEGMLPQSTRRALVTARAQGRNIPPWQAAIENKLASGQGLSNQEMMAMGGPDQQAQQMQRDAAMFNAIANVAANSDGMLPPAMTQWLEQQAGRDLGTAAPWETSTSTIGEATTGGQGPYVTAMKHLKSVPALARGFEEAVAKKDADAASTYMRMAGVPEDVAAGVLKAMTGKEDASYENPTGKRQGILDWLRNVNPDTSKAVPSYATVYPYP